MGGDHTGKNISVFQPPIETTGRGQEARRDPPMLVSLSCFYRLWKETELI